MTKVGRLFEEEKIEYANEYAQKYAQEYANEKMLRTARTLLEKNVDILTIMESTGLSKATILKLKDTPVKAQA